MPDNSNFDILASQTVSGGASNQAPINVDPELRKVYLQFAENTSGDDESDNAQLRQRSNGRQAWIILHGWNANYDNFRAIASEIKDANPNDIVLTLNWLEASSSSTGTAADLATFGNYYAATWIGPVAEVVAQHLKLWGIDPQSVNLVGHSLGALLASEIAYQLNQQNGQDPPNYQAAKVNTITALDPPSENQLGRTEWTIPNPIPGLPPISIPVPDRFKDGYVYPRNGEDVRPVPFNQVANFSRSFLGRSSLSGNVEFASWANEAITIDFGLEGVNPDRQHGDVYRVFQELIAANGTKLAKDLFGLNDKSRHVDFKTG